MGSIGTWRTFHHRRWWLVKEEVMDLRGYTTLDEVGGDDKVRNNLNIIKNKPTTAAEEIDYINEILNKIEQEQSKDNVGEAMCSNSISTESHVDRSDVNNILCHENKSNYDDAKSVCNIR